MFEKTFPLMTGHLDQQWAQSLQGPMTDLADRPPALRGQFQDIIRNNVIGRAGDDGTLTGDALGAADSKLGTLARQYGRDPDTDKQALAMALRQAQGALRDLAMRQNPDVAPTLQAAREGWANLVRIEQAGANVGAKEGVFTPNHLMQATRAGDASAGHSGFGQGHALMQDLGSAGQQVLPATVPDSGTASRGLMTAALLGAGGVAGHMMGGEGAAALSPSTIAGVAAPVAAGTALALPYTQPGLALARALLAGRRPGAVQAAGNAIRQIPAPATTAAGVNTAQLMAQLLSAQSATAQP